MKPFSVGCSLRSDDARDTDGPILFVVFGFPFDDMKGVYISRFLTSIRFTFV